MTLSEICPVDLSKFEELCEIFAGFHFYVCFDSGDVIVLENRIANFEAKLDEMNCNCFHVKND